MKKLVIASLLFLPSLTQASDEFQYSNDNFSYLEEEYDQGCTELKKNGTVWTCILRGEQSLPDVAKQTFGLIDRVNYDISTSIDSNKLDEYIGDGFIQLPKISSIWVAKGNSDDIKIKLDLAPKIDLEENADGLVICKEFKFKISKFDIDFTPDWIDAIAKNKVNNDTQTKEKLCNQISAALIKIQKESY